ncbi:SRPBCC family protein [Streptosporangium amethystogenes]|uniref:SRPBCC family protein n=1 Tax=Streptosporangium amethystogenes TaxID=2002 RepID=UPI00055ADFBE|nr:SRPBCC family protein [Streptosporangium amethystogenes]
MEHRTERSDTYSVSIEAPPEFVWQAMADVEEWPRFSPFALAVTRTSEKTFDVTGPQGPVVLATCFDRDLLLLDHKVVLSDGAEVFIPYRVAPNHLGSELIMTNVKSPGDSPEEYAEQLEWMRKELHGAKDYVEGLCRA